MKEVKIEAGKRYLVETTFPSGSQRIIRLTIKEVTETCYLIRVDGECVDAWKYRKDFGLLDSSDVEYKFIECLGEEKSK